MARPPALLPSAAHVGRIVLQVGNLERSLRFYEGAIGFHHQGTITDGGSRTAALGIRGRPEPLLQLVEKAGTRPVPRRGLIGLYHFAVLLPDRAALGRFIVHAANAGARFAAADHGFSEALYLTDPDGLQIEVYRDLPRSEWTFANDEIVGATLPLDIDPIVASAAGTGWDGLPPGTTIGHVHLSVRDLDQARAFYVEALGFAPTITSFPGALFVAAGGYHHHVGLNTWAAGAPMAGDDDAKLIMWDLVLPDAAGVRAVAERLRQAGYDVSRDGDDAIARDTCNITLRVTSAP